MPVINVDDLTDKDKAVMEVNQLKVEVKLERWLVSSSLRNVNFYYEDIGTKTLVSMSRSSVKLFLMACIWSRQTSKCCEEIKEYIQAGVEEDILVKGIPEDKNPFKEKGGCVIC